MVKRFTIEEYDEMIEKIMNPPPQRSPILPRLLEVAKQRGAKPPKQPQIRGTK